MAGRDWTDEVALQIVAETYAHGVSVAEVALRHAANANLIFIWRKDPRFNPRLAGTAFLPVEIMPEPSRLRQTPVSKHMPDVPDFDTCTEPPGIEMALPSGVRLTCRCGIDTAALADVLRVLILLRRHRVGSGTGGSQTLFATKGQPVSFCRQAGMRKRRQTRSGGLILGSIESRIVLVGW